MTLAGDNLTMYDIVQGYGDANVNKRVIPILAKRNAFIRDAVWKASTHMDKNVETVQAFKPVSSIGAYGKGTKSSKGATKQITDQIGFIENRSIVDARMGDLGLAEFQMARRNSDDMIVDALADDAERYMFYGQYKPTDGTRGLFDGIATRYGTLSGEYGKQVIDAGGTGSDNMSFYGITWSDQDTFCLYPKGADMGLKITDKGERTTRDEDGNEIDTLQTYFQWYLGLATPNYKNNFRVANIDLSDLSTGSAANLIQKILDGIRLLQDPPNGFAPLDGRGYDAKIQRVGGAKTAIYCCPTLYYFLEDQANAKTVNGLTMGQAFGTQYPLVRGVPVRLTNGLVTSETRVVA